MFFPRGWFQCAEAIEINLEASDNSGIFSRQVLGPATETVPEWVESVLVRPG